ncbi:MAG: hypothetical protein DWH97_09175 [Planctomycetota bacterium]|nr:MAG: hypothetical protein DWH97_09175 [Planctomycetota bacterium]RLS92106.1 MAG: hypothetical protein DWI12_12000 [Planctomycetota bacterium]
MPQSRRPLPHLHLTAAILVAMLAVLSTSMAGGYDSNWNERARRTDLRASNASWRGGSNLVRRLVALPELGGARVPQIGALHTTVHHIAVSSTTANVVSNTALARAQRRIQVDASRACRAALLKTSALPPPCARA